MINKRKFSPFIYLLAITGVFSLAVLNGQINRGNNSKSVSEKMQDIQSTFPVVDFSDPPPIDENRKRKSEKYDEFKTIHTHIHEDSTEFINIDWATGLPPLPLEKSEIILLGTVVDAKAHLSPKKDSVYSEFKIEIGQLFKNSSSQEKANGKYISVEREGGVVRLPSGYKSWVLISGQRMPKVGGRYVFFLTHDFPLYGRQNNDLYLLTAYELRDALVFPLDEPDAGTHPIATFYKGRGEQVLLNDLLNALRTQ